MLKRIYLIDLELVQSFISSAKIFVIVKRENALRHLMSSIYYALSGYRRPEVVFYMLLA